MMRWLALVIIGLMLLSPFFGDGEINNEQDGYIFLYVLLSTVITVSIAGAIGYGFYSLFNVETPQTPLDYARKWLASAFFLTCLSALPSFIRYLDANSFAIWVLLTVVTGTFAGTFGWLYGRFYKFNNNNRSKSNSRRGHVANKSDITDTYYYEIAWKELIIKRVNEGLWAKAFAQANGNMEKTKAIYLESRARQLRESERIQKTKEKSRQWNIAISNVTSYALNAIGRAFMVMVAVISNVGVIGSIFAMVEYELMMVVGLIFFGPLAYWSTKRVINS